MTKLEGHQQGLHFTGERLVTEIYEYWSIEHLHRYALAMELLAGKHVLDVASGEGYGTNLLASVAASVVGVDISREAVEHAAAKYSRPNLSFRHGSATAIPLADQSIDVVTSFETIEHHDEHDAMLLAVKRVLKPGGLLMISSPDKQYYTDEPSYHNPFHVKELYKHEFETLIGRYFKHVLPLNQKTVFGSVVNSNVNATQPLIEYSGNYLHIEKGLALKSALYNICIASDEPLSGLTLPENSIFCNKDVFDLYTGLKSQNDELLRRNAELMKLLNSPVQKVARALASPIHSIKKLFR